MHTITVRTVTGHCFRIQVEHFSTVAEGKRFSSIPLTVLVKEIINKEGHVCPQKQVLFFKKGKMDDDKTLDECGVKVHDTIDLVPAISTEPSLLLCLVKNHLELLNSNPLKVFGFLSVFPKPEIPFPKDQVPFRHLKTHLICKEPQAPPVIFKIQFDIQKLLTTLKANEKSSPVYKEWNDCAEFLSRDITICIKKFTTKELVIQKKLNFHIQLPNNIDELENTPNPEFSFSTPELQPFLKYLLILKCEGMGLVIEFETGINEIQRLLTEVGMEKYYQIFLKNKIFDKFSLILVTDDHLKEMGIPIGERIYLMQTINDLGKSIRMEEG